MKRITPVDVLPAREPRSGRIHVLIDTPAGSRNKYKYDADLGVFRISRVLPVGMQFPYDFGSIPQTREAGRTVRNDRLIAIGETPVNRASLRQLRELDAQRLRDIEHFFDSYNRRQGREFRIIGRNSRGAAHLVLERGLRTRVQRCGRGVAPDGAAGVAALAAGVTGAGTAAAGRAESASARGGLPGTHGLVGKSRLAA